MTNAERQAKFRAAQKDLGRSQRVLYLTNEEIAAVKALLKKLRED